MRSVHQYFENFADSWKKIINKTPVETVKELALTVEGYFNFSDFNENGNQLHPLHVAAERGHLNLCQHIVEKTGDFNPASQPFESTALHFAAYQGHLEVYQFILDNVDEKNPVDAEGDCPFFWAVQNNQVKFCRVIIKTLEEKIPADNLGFTALHQAASRGNLEMYQLLIDNMTGNKNPRDFYGWTPLHWAAEHGCIEVCQLIAVIAQDLEDKNPMTNDGATPKQLMNDYIEDLKKNTNDLFQ
mgnify:CR=1 FL=1